MHPRDRGLSPTLPEARTHLQLHFIRLQHGVHCYWDFVCEMVTIQEFDHESSRVMPYSHGCDWPRPQTPTLQIPQPPVSTLKWSLPSPSFSASGNQGELRRSKGPSSPEPLRHVGTPLSLSFTILKPLIHTDPSTPPVYCHSWVYLNSPLSLSVSLLPPIGQEVVLLWAFLILYVVITRAAYKPWAFFSQSLNL